MTGFMGTPGPYKAHPVDMFGDYTIVIDDNQNDTLAIAAVISNMRPSDEVAANAALFGATHDLLTALEEMLSQFDADEFGSEGQMQACSKARAAIARALGEGERS